MSGFTVIKKAVNKVEYQGKTYTCNGERIIIDGQVRWLYRTNKGLDYDILVCDDRYAEEPEFTHLTKLPSGCYTLPSEISHEYVDLGLPSGTLWATENIKDANGNELYFAWGETQGYTSGQVGTDKYFAWDGDNADYKYGTFNDSDEENFGMEKYNNTDGKTELESTDDAATANWGTGWRMPTKEQFDELIANTTTAWTQVDGVNGMLCTSTANGNTLFFPAVGDAENGGVNDVVDYGNYWSVSLNDKNVFNALELDLDDGGCGVGNDGRCFGYSVRPVRVPV